MEKVNECRMDLIKGIYDVYCITKDKQDSIETLSKTVHKNFK